MSNFAARCSLVSAAPNGRRAQNLLHPLPKQPMLADRGRGSYIQSGLAKNAKYGFGGLIDARKKPSRPRTD
jgi:hypothetical protein